MNIGEKIKELRIKKGLTQEQLAFRSNFSKSYIQKFEEGQREIKSSQLVQLSFALEIDISDLIDASNFITNEFIIKNIEFREAKNITFGADYFEKKVLAYLYKQYSAYVKLEKALNELVMFSNPLKNFSEINSNSDVEDAVKIIRKKLRFDDTPIFSVIAYLEDVGIKIFEIDQEDSFVGFSCWVKNTPVIVINSNNTAITRRRFTVLHELAHLILKFKDFEKQEIIERYCNQFAGAMLLPENVLRFYISSDTSISLEELKRIKNKYGISIQAILIRMVNVGMISWNKYEEWNLLYKSWSNDQIEFSGNERVGRFRYLLAKGLRESLISKDLASELSGIPMSELNKTILNQEFKF